MSSQGGALKLFLANARAGALLQWLKLPACKVGDCGFEPHSGLQVSKKQNVSYRFNIVGSLRDREVACSTSDYQGPNLELCVWREVSPHYPQKVLLAQFSLSVHKGGLKPHSFHFLPTQFTTKIYYNFFI